MSRLPVVCTACQTPLTNGLDTFGDIDQPFCWPCYGALNGESGPHSGYYGLAPHHHDLSITGSIIGSTVFDPLPARDANGDYIVGNMIYTPDPSVKGGGLGFWSHRPLPGWR